MVFKIDTDYIMGKLADKPSGGGANRPGRSLQVRSIQYNPQRNIFTATVSDPPHERNVSVVFSLDGRPATTQCSCRLYSSRDSFCSHIASVLTLIHERDKDGFFDGLKDREKAKRIFDLFAAQGVTGQAAGRGAAAIGAAAGGAGQRGLAALPGAGAGAGLGQAAQQLVSLEPILFVSDEWTRSYGALRTSVYFRIGGPPDSGASYSYIVKDVAAFLRALRTRRPFAFGKKFTFDAARHCFGEPDAQLVELLQEMFEQDPAHLRDTLDMGYYYNTRAVDAVLNQLSAFSGKFLRLADAPLRKLLDIVERGGGRLSVELEGSRERFRAAVGGELRVKFRLSRDKGDFILRIDTGGNVFPMTESADAVLCKGAASLGRVCRLRREQAAVLLPLLKAIGQYGEKEFRFISHDRGRFVSEIMPAIDLIGALDIDDDVATLIDRQPLLAEIYLDREPGGGAVTADVKFCYGEHRAVNPFAAAPKSARPDDVIVVRDVARESAILDILAESDFIVKNGRINLYDDDSIFGFVVDILPKLQPHAAVYYSESFKRSSIQSKMGFRVSMSFQRSDNGLLDLDFDTEFIPRGELMSIMQSIREKKRYYKLKDGAMLNLMDREAADIAGLLEFVGAGSDDILSGHVALPKYRAVYLDYFLRNSEIKNVGRDRILKEFVRAITEPVDNEFAIPEAVGHCLRDYQKTGVKWLGALSANSLGGILADDMGLGKTVQVLALLLAAKEAGETGGGALAGAAAGSGALAPAAAGAAGSGALATAATGGGSLALVAAGAAGSGALATDATGGGALAAADAASGAAAGEAGGGSRGLPSLIVVPTSLVYNWRAEIEKFTPQLSHVIITGMKPERSRLIQTIPGYDVAITSYPLMRRDYEEYKGMRFRYCILDEAQHIKNPMSQNALSVKCLDAACRFALTGTPMENRLLELWSLFDFVLPGYLYSAKEFGKRYSDAMAMAPMITAKTVSESGAEGGAAGGDPDEYSGGYSGDDPDGELGDDPDGDPGGASGEPSPGGRGAGSAALSAASVASAASATTASTVASATTAASATSAATATTVAAAASATTAATAASAASATSIATIATAILPDPAAGPAPEAAVPTPLAELSGQIRPFVLRRLKTDVLKELPDKIDTTMLAAMTAPQKKIYAVYVEKIRNQITSEIAENGFQKSQIVILALLTRLRQICCHPSLFIENYADDSGKLLLLQEIVLDAIDGGHRILLFSQFTSMLAIIREWAEKKEKLRCHYIDGQVKPLERHRRISEFNAGDGELFLLSLKAGGLGVNLTGADMVIHYDPWWNPAAEDQATDRAYRIGQKKTVQVVKLLTAGSIEEKIFSIQERKKRLIDAVIKPGETFLAKLTQADLDEILTWNEY